MTWQKLRQYYPHSWLVVEAVGAFTENDQRMIPEFRLVAAFGSDWQAAWDHYTMLHHADKQREYYGLHTDRETLDIGVLDSFWRMVA